MTEAHAFDFVEKVSGVRNVEQLEAALTAICRRFSLPHYFACFYLKPAGRTAEPVTLTNLGQDWLRVYAARRYEKIDPIVSHCRSQSAPILWWDEAKDIRFEKSVEEFIGHATRRGLRSGITIPVYAPANRWGWFSFSCAQKLQESRSHIEAIALQLQLLAYFLFDAASQVLARMSRYAESPCRLTRREEECLQLCAQGLTSKEISKVLGISASTVVFHTGNASRKLGVRNRMHAVARSLAISGNGRISLYGTQECPALVRLGQDYVADTIRRFSAPGEPPPPAAVGVRRAAIKR